MASSDSSSRTSSPGADAAHRDRAVEPEYAAISGGAVAALVLAGVSVIALLPKQAPIPLPFGVRYRLPVLLLVPLAVIPFSLFVIRRIRNSAGTKVGMPLARAALALAGLVAVGSIAMHGLRQHREFELHDTLAEQAEVYLRRIFDEQYRAVYDAMAANYPELYPQEVPFEQWRRRTHRALYGAGDYYGKSVQRVLVQHPDEAEQGLRRADWWCTASSLPKAART